jgi:GrpB-like predicted nucleotidyltransferase (UPF0157 family)
VNQSIDIVEYDPQWPLLFEQEKTRILDVLRGFDIVVEHVGSTSVPGLAAKAIIDLLLVVSNSEEAVRAITPLVSLEYECRGEAGIPGRIFFRKGVPRTHHLHLYARGHSEIKRHLLFRDYLRANPEAARAYAELKRALAEKFRHDRDAYSEAKTDFIRAAEAQASQRNIQSQ